MAKVKLMDVIETKYPSIVHEMLSMREKGASFDKISVVVSNSFGLDVSRSLIRRWFLDREGE